MGRMIDEGQATMDQLEERLRVLLYQGRHWGMPPAWHIEAQTVLDELSTRRKSTW